MQKKIRLSDYTYHLPEDKVALYPLAQRDHAKLLFYRQGKIRHHRFRDLPGLLPPCSTLFFNDTRVIPARILFRKETGAQIEVFLLQPVDGQIPVQLAMQAQHHARWVCTVGNLKKWKEAKK